MDQEIDYRSGERFNDNLIEYPGFPEIEALLKQDRAARFDRDQPDEVEQGLRREFAAAAVVGCSDPSSPTQITNGPAAPRPTPSSTRGCP